MKTLHFYVMRQVLAALVMTVTVFTFVLLLGNLLKEILALLVNRLVTFGVVFEAIALLVPYVLAFSLPMGMLTATLLVFGRFSADQELTAIRANGVSLVALVTPVLLFSAALCCLSAFVNMEVAPRCRVAYKELLFRLAAEQASALILEGQLHDDFPGYSLRVGRKDGAWLRNVFIGKLDEQGRSLKDTYSAVSARIVSQSASNVVLQLHLVTHNHWDSLNPKTTEVEEQVLTLDYRPPSGSTLQVSMGNMTFDQLCRKLRELELLNPLAEPIQEADSEALREQQRRYEAATSDLTSPIRVQIHRQIAFSFASIGFTLIGIPLGIRAHRRETSAGIAMALILVLIYYGFVVFGQSLETRPEFAPHLILWLPNFIFQAVGGVLLWRANRGF